MDSEKLFQYALSQTDQCYEQPICSVKDESIKDTTIMAHYGVPYWVNSNADLHVLSLARKMCNPFMPSDKWETLLLEEVMVSEGLDDILATAFRVNSWSETLYKVEIESNHILDFEKIRAESMSRLTECFCNNFNSDCLSALLSFKDNKL